MSKKEIYKVAVLGAGNMGTSIAQVIASNGHEVRLWNHAGDLLPLKQISKYRINKKYLPKIKLSKNILPISDLQEAIKGVRVVFLVVPSFCIKSVVEQVSKFLPKNIVCVDVSKGLDDKDNTLVPKIIKDSLADHLQKNIVSISGPAIAVDMALGKFTAMNIAGSNKKSVQLAQLVLQNKNLKLLEIDDMIGLEVGGSFKNVYAIALGFCEGLKLPENTKAVFLTYALKEISELIVKMGGQKETAYNLCGLGDLLATSMCSTSRNHRFGGYLAQGKNVQWSLKKVGQVVEGLSAVKVLRSLAKKYKVEVPLADLVYKSLDPKNNLQKSIDKFLASIA